MSKAKKIPYGMTDLEAIIREGYYYATMATMDTQTVQLTIDVDASMKRAIMQVLKQIKGVVKVKDTTPKSNMSKEEYYKMLDLSIEQARNGQTTAMQDNETAEQFLNRLICTQ